MSSSTSKRAFVSFLAVAAVGCNLRGPTAPDPETYNETFMVAQVIRIERAMNVGAFEPWFSDPPVKTWAGWAYCGTDPHQIFFNKEWVNSLDASRQAYMTALVAHEMCHHYVSIKGGNCWDEVAAEECARRFE